MNHSSADSGLATFRDAGGLWEGRRPEEVATPEAFVSDPAMVHRFYNSRRLQLRDAEPNDAHRALVEWEKATPDFLLVTQNVDDLHEWAGSGKLRHMHGELKRVKCEFCDHDRPEAGEISTETVCEKCGQSGGMRPAVVWFGEMPLHMEEIFWALDACTLFVSIGTSGNVYPAAGFVDAANRTGARTVELNLEPSTTASAFRECIHGRAAEIVPAFVERFL